MVAGMYGGKGKILLCLVALLLIYTIKNGLVQVGLSEYYQYLVIGLLMLAACILQTGRK
jgi:ribose/xylose/arabinose/galactoside ABC-type transport system permease subunit